MPLAAFNSAIRVGAACVAHVSVGSEVYACKENWLPEFFQSYFGGNIIAEKAAIDAVGGDAKKVCLLKPTFIYGGAEFKLLPPRVNYEYGSGVEELLMLPYSRFLRMPHLAWSLPTRAACANAALDDSGADLAVLDGAEEINAYSGQPKSPGLTDALEWSKEKAIEFYGWAKVEVPKAIDAVQSKIDESRK